MKEYHNVFYAVNISFLLRIVLTIFTIVPLEINGIHTRSLYQK